MLVNTVIASIFVIITVVIIIFLKSKRNNKYFYRFYSDRFTYIDTFWGRKAKVVKYSDFKEVRYNQGYLQSKFNVGEIYILTNRKNLFDRILLLKSIPDVEKNYEKILKIFKV